jgi:Tol biopolymer transport system component
VPLDGSPPSHVPSNVAIPTKGIDVSRDRSLVVWSTCSTEQDVAALRAPSDGAPLALQPILPKTEWTDEQAVGIPGAPSKLVVVSDRTAKRQLWVLDLSAKEPARRLPMGDLEAAAPAVSQDGKWVVFTGIGRGIFVAPLDGSSDARRVAEGTEDTGATFARDGASVFFTAVSGDKRSIVRLALDGSSARATLVENADRASASPTDDRVAYVALDGDAGTPMIVDLTTKRARPLSPSLGKGSYGGLRFSPDGKRVVVSVGLTDLVEVDATSGAELRKFTSGDQIISVAYVGKDITVSRIGWRGDLWSAKDPWRKP